MNNKIVEDLCELGIYNSKTLSENDFNKLSKNNSNSSLIYISGYSDDGFDEDSKYFKQIDTKGLTLNDIKLQLEINRTKNIKSIKKMVTFFVILTVITLIAMFFFGMSLSEASSNIRY